MSCTLTLKNLSYTRDERVLFDNVSLHLTHKKKIAIVGSNGCGKTTLLKIASGLKMPTGGHVELFHNKMESLKDFDAFRDKIGFVFQDSDDQFLCPTVLEDVAFGLLNQGMNKKEAKEKAEAKLEKLGIWNLRECVPMRLSGGEKKLVALAGVLILEPAILLLDEPSNGLDKRTEEKVLEILNGLDSSMLIVSHEWDFLKNCEAEFMELSEEGLRPCHL